MWRLDQPVGEVETFVLDWLETGVANGSAPLKAQGYGSQLIERALPYSLGGEVSYGLTEDGVRCVFKFPVQKVVA